MNKELTMIRKKYLLKLIDCLNLQIIEQDLKIQEIEKKLKLKK